MIITNLFNEEISVDLDTADINLVRHNLTAKKFQQTLWVLIIREKDTVRWKELNFYRLEDLQMAVSDINEMFTALKNRQSKYIIKAAIDPKVLLNLYASAQKTEE